MMAFYFQLVFILGMLMPLPQEGEGRSGTVRVLMTGIEFLPDDPIKDAMEKPFHIEAVFEVSDCRNELTSIEVYNAHPPLTWYELNEAGQKVHTLFNPRLNWFNDHTTYMVQDMTQHTDTIYIDFDQVLEVRRIYPNPHRGILFVDYSAIEPTGMEVLIMDLSGRYITRDVLMLAPGENRLSLNPGDLMQGVYFLRLTGPCINELFKIIRLE